MMKYAIVHLLTGKAREYHVKLVKTLAKEFNEPYLIKNPIPSHITLKYSFKTNKIKEIEKSLESFIKDKKQSDIKIRKINNFDKKVLYLQVDFSKKATKVYRELLKELKKIKYLNWRKFDAKEKFHATIIYANTKENYRKISRKVFKIKPKLDIKFDNISILKKQKNKWKIHKIYKITR